MVNIDFKALKLHHKNDLSNATGARVEIVFEEITTFPESIDFLINEYSEIQAHCKFRGIRLPFIESLERELSPHFAASMMYCMYHASNTLGIHKHSVQKRVRDKEDVARRIVSHVDKARKLLDENMLWLGEQVVHFEDILNVSKQLSRIGIYMDEIRYSLEQKSGTRSQERAKMVQHGFLRAAYKIYSLAIPDYAEKFRCELNSLTEGAGIIPGGCIDKLRYACAECSVYRSNFDFPETNLSNILKVDFVAP